MNYFYDILPRTDNPWKRKNAWSKTSFRGKSSARGVLFRHTTVCTVATSSKEAPYYLKFKARYRGRNKSGQKFEMYLEYWSLWPLNNLCTWVKVSRLTKKAPKREIITSFNHYKVHVKKLSWLKIKLWLAKRNKWCEIHLLWSQKSFFTQKNGQIWKLPAYTASW